MTDPTVDEIAVAHTPPGGYGDDTPPPILAGCVDPLVDGAPDLRGWWRTVEVFVDGAPQGGHPGLGHLQRVVEQAGDRVVVTGGGVVHDMRCDGSETNGVHDVAEFDMTTEITVVATYEEGVHVLRPVGMPIEVKRWRAGADMMWQYLGFTARLAKVADADADPDASR